MRLGLTFFFPSEVGVAMTGCYATHTHTPPHHHTHPSLSPLWWSGQAAYKKLGLITFYTSGETETRAWTVPLGATAPNAAGKIHTDFEKGFIRAETTAYAALVRAPQMRGNRQSLASTLVLALSHLKDIHRALLSLAAVLKKFVHASPHGLRSEPFGTGRARERITVQGKRAGPVRGQGVRGCRRRCDELQIQVMT